MKSARSVLASGNRVFLDLAGLHVHATHIIRPPVVVPGVAAARIEQHVMRISAGARNLILNNHGTCELAHGTRLEFDREPCAVRSANLRQILDHVSVIADRALPTGRGVDLLVGSRIRTAPGWLLTGVAVGA